MACELPVRLQTLLEMNYDELFANTLSAFPNTNKRQHLLGEVRVEQIAYTVAQPSNAITVRSKTNGNETNTHEQAIMMSGVQFSPEGVEIPGNQQRMIPLSAAVEDLKVRCTCSDFYWRFATWDAAQKALIGNPPPPYVKKTDRPPVNPDQSPGICKHIMAVVERIKRDGLITGG